MFDIVKQTMLRNAAIEKENNKTLQKFSFSSETSFSSGYQLHFSMHINLATGWPIDSLTLQLLLCVMILHMEKERVYYIN